MGWYLTKHAVGVYSTIPPPRPYAAVDAGPIQRAIDAESRPALVEAPHGGGTIETYTVLHGRDGEPVRGIVIGRLDDGRRFLANTPSDPTLLDDLTREEGIGRRGRVESAPDGNTFTPTS